MGTLDSVNATIDLQSKNVALDLLNTLKTNGFAILKNHSVSLALLSELYTEWSYFFENNKKYDWIRSDYDDEGYVPINTEIAVGYNVADHKEFYQSHKNGRYPDFINLDITEKLVFELTTLGENLLGLIQGALPENITDNMKTTLPAMIENCNKHGFRVIHYPEIEKGKFSTRAEEHGDICLLTILPNPTSEGLELQAPNGVWHAPEIANNDILVFNADMLEMCTNGYLKSTTHKVNSNLAPDKKPARYSFPIFIHPRREIELKPGISALNALRKRLTEIGYQGDFLEK
jgi:isopenicillin N synthase-like dioxygenase